jgi:predicted NAD/FAD-dependent oxidoreductase
VLFLEVVILFLVIVGANYTEAVMSELHEWLHTLPEAATTTQELEGSKKQQLAKLAGGWITSKLMGAMAERKIDIRT